MPEWIDKEGEMARQPTPRISGHVSWMVEAQKRVEIEPDLFRTSRRIDLGLLGMWVAIILMWGGLAYWVAISLSGGR